jgi:hypothetical protein
MDKETLEKRIKELNKLIKAENYDRERLTDIANEFGIALPKNTGCSDCWKDFSIVLRSALKTELLKMTDSRKYILKDGVDVIFNGERINNGMLTDKKAKQIIEEGFPKYLFARA